MSRNLQFLNLIKAFIKDEICHIHVMISRVNMFLIVEEVESPITLLEV